MLDTHKKDIQKIDSKKAKVKAFSTGHLNENFLLLLKLAVANLYRC